MVHDPQGRIEVSHETVCQLKTILKKQICEISARMCSSGDPLEDSSVPEVVKTRLHSLTANNKVQVLALKQKTFRKLRRLKNPLPRNRLDSVNNSRVFTSTSTSTFSSHPPIPHHLHLHYFLPDPPFVCCTSLQSTSTRSTLSLSTSTESTFFVLSPPRFVHLYLHLSINRLYTPLSTPPCLHPTRLRSTHHIRHINSLFRHLYLHLHLHLTLILPLVIHLLQHNRHNQPNPAPTAMLLLEGTLFKILI